MYYIIIILVVNKVFLIFINPLTHTHTHTQESIHPIAQARCLFEVALRGQISLRWMEFPNLHCIAVVQ